MPFNTEIETVFSVDGAFVSTNSEVPDIYAKIGQMLIKNVSKENSLTKLWHLKTLNLFYAKVWRTFDRERITIDINKNGIFLHSWHFPSENEVIYFWKYSKIKKRRLLGIGKKSSSERLMKNHG